VLVPVQAEYYALEGLAQLVQSVELVRAALNPRLALGGVLLTMVDGARGSRATSPPRCGGTSASSSSSRRAAVGALAEAPSHGLPVTPTTALGRRRRVLEGGDGACRAA
jgi:chromosome partitioning protein